MAEKKCGDCIHADVCEHNPNIPLFNRANAAYCKGFKDRTSVVEVVRCKDCKHYYPFDNECDEPHTYYTEEGYREVYDNDFCSYGERRTK